MPQCVPGLIESSAGEQQCLASMETKSEYREQGVWPLTASLSRDDGGGAFMQDTNVGGGLMLLLAPCCRRLRRSRGRSTAGSLTCWRAWRSAGWRSPWGSSGRGAGTTSPTATSETVFVQWNPKRLCTCRFGMACTQKHAKHHKDEPQGFAGRSKSWPAEYECGEPVLSELNVPAVRR